MIYFIHMTRPDAERVQWLTEIDPDGQGGSSSNFASPRQADLLRERMRKLAAQAQGETGPNIELTEDERRIDGEFIDAGFVV